MGSHLAWAKVRHWICCPNWSPEIRPAASSFTLLRQLAGLWPIVPRYPSLLEATLDLGTVLIPHHGLCMESGPDL